LIPHSAALHQAAHFLFLETCFMANITFIEASGQSTTVDLADGWNLMQGAIANGIDGILGECGGSCACATCHCYVDDARIGDLIPATEGELSMLDNVASERRPNSRLACQIKATTALEGLIVHLPATQE
jgi:2Fe-2S ferredoxin